MLSLSTRNPTVPSMSSRTMSAWPACRSVSAMTCTRIVLSVTAALVRPPRHATGRIEWERVDRDVRVRPHPAVQADDVLARLVSGGPHVGVRLGVVLHPRLRLGERPPEGVAEVADLDAGAVLDEPQQVRAGRHHRPAHVVLREVVELPQQRASASLQVPAERTSHRRRARPSLTPQLRIETPSAGERIDINGHPTWIDDLERRRDGAAAARRMSNSDLLAGVLAEPLLERYRAVAFDRRAHGYTADPGGSFHYVDMAGDTIGVLEQVVGARPTWSAERRGDRCPARRHDAARSRQSHGHHRCQLPL